LAADSSSRENFQVTSGSLASFTHVPTSFSSKTMVSLVNSGCNETTGTQPASSAAKA
jgi:hypothetical protein